MKRIVAVILPIRSATTNGDAEPAGPVESNLPQNGGGGAGAPTGPLTDKSELRVEALLSDGHARWIVDSLLERETRSEIDSIINYLLDVSLEMAGPEACDLYERIVVPLERQLISRVYAESDHIKTKASARLGINRNTMHKKLKEHHLLDDDRE